jgi:hypothetical protein
VELELAELALGGGAALRAGDTVVLDCAVAPPPGAGAVALDAPPGAQARTVVPAAPEARGQVEGRALPLRRTLRLPLPAALGAAVLAGGPPHWELQVPTAASYSSPYRVSYGSLNPPPPPTVPPTACPTGA